MTTERKPWGQRMFINRDFGLLFLGRLVSQIGDGVHYLALTWLVLDLTSSGTALGTMLFASSIPAVLLAPFSGVLADLWDRKTIVVSMDIVRGLILLVLAAIFHTGQLTLAILYVATIFSSLCGVLFGPAISATIPGLVKKEELVKANALNNFSRGATMIVGPVLGAFLLGTTGYLGVFLINGIAFLISAVSEMFIRFPVMVREESLESELLSPSSKFLKSLKEGFTYIWSNAGLKAIILFAVALNFVSSPLFSVILPYFGKEVLQLGAQQFGFVQASLPVGFLVGTVLISWLTKKYRKEHLLVFGITVQGIMTIGVGVLAIPSVYGVMKVTSILLSLSTSMLFVGILNTLVNVPFQVMLQETVPDSYRGRVYGLLDSMVQMLVPISMALSGVLVDNFSSASLLLFSGIIVIILGVGMALSQNIKLLYVDQVSAHQG